MLARLFGNLHADADSFGDRPFPPLAFFVQRFVDRERNRFAELARQFSRQLRSLHILDVQLYARGFYPSAPRVYHQRSGRQ